MGKMVSVIVVAEEFNENLRECLRGLEGQSYRDFEVVVVVTDKGEIRERGGVREIGGRQGGPSEKRNYGVEKAKGEILAFLDDDCVSAKDWLKEGVNLFHLEGGSIGAVCGPMVTPSNSPFMERVAGYLLESWIVMGKEKYRNCVEKLKFIDDYPSANFFIRKEDFLKIGGFDHRFWPGEDTKLCLDIIDKLGKKIVYDPRVLVYHRRRALFKPFLKQVGRYARQRGRFVRLFPETSRKVQYFIPSGFVISIGILGILGKLEILGFYLILIIIEGLKVFLKEKNVLMMIFFIVGVFFTHIVYGINFLRGLISYGED